MTKIIDAIRVIGRGIAGIGAFASCAGMPFKKYPFTFPEKALTADWKTLGEDMTLALEKANKGKK